MIAHPPWWELADHELELRIVAPSDRTVFWRLMYGQTVSTALQRVGQNATPYSHNWGYFWPYQ